MQDVLREESTLISDSIAYHYHKASPSDLTVPVGLLLPSLCLQEIILAKRALLYRELCILLLYSLLSNGITGQPGALDTASCNTSTLQHTVDFVERIVRVDESTYRRGTSKAYNVHVCSSKNGDGGDKHSSSNSSSKSNSNSSSGKRELQPHLHPVVDCGSVKCLLRDAKLLLRIRKCRCGASSASSVDVDTHIDTGNGSSDSDSNNGDNVDWVEVQKVFAEFDEANAAYYINDLNCKPYVANNKLFGKRTASTGQAYMQSEGKNSDLSSALSNLLSGLSGRSGIGTHTSTDTSTDTDTEKEKEKERDIPYIPSVFNYPVLYPVWREVSLIRADAKFHLSLLHYSMLVHSSFGVTARIVKASQKQLLKQTRNRNRTSNSNSNTNRNHVGARDRDRGRGEHDAKPHSHELEGENDDVDDSDLDSDTDTDSYSDSSDSTDSWDGSDSDDSQKESTSESGCGSDDGSYRPVHHVGGDEIGIGNIGNIGNTDVISHSQSNSHNHLYNHNTAPQASSRSLSNPLSLSSLNARPLSPVSSAQLGKFIYLYVYIYILLDSYSIFRGALGSSDLLPSYFIITLA